MPKGAQRSVDRETTAHTHDTEGQGLPQVLNSDSDSITNNKYTKTKTENNTNSKNTNTNTNTNTVDNKQTNKQP